MFTSSPPTRHQENSSPQMENSTSCTPEPHICVFPTHFSSLQVRSRLSKLPLSFERRRERTVFKSPFCTQHSISCFPTKQFAWSTSYGYREDICSVLALPVLISWVPFFLTQSSSYTSIWIRFYFELFILPGMTDVRLNCKTPQLYIPCIHLQSINASRCFSAGRHSSLRPSSATPRNCSSQPFRAYTTLHIHFSPLMGSSIVSSNVIIWILAETFEVYLGGPLSWAEPRRATEMGYYGYLRIATAFLLAGINYNVAPPWYPAWCEPFAFRQNGAKITNICLIEILEGCYSLYSPT